jgi:hypothetical protein
VTKFAGDHPEPPGNINKRSPLLRNFAIGAIFYRIHNKTNGPVFFGKTGGNRFDSPDASFGVMYVGLDEHCAFIEVFGQSTGVSVVTRDALVQRHISYLKITRELNLVDLAASGGLARIGADAGLLSGPPEITQRWSAALRRHPSKPHGLLYPAKHDVARNACALFDLPASAFQVTKTESLLDPSSEYLLAAILDTYDFGLID